MHHGIMISQCKYSQKITNNICKDKNYFGLKAEKKSRFFDKCLIVALHPTQLCFKCLLYISYYIIHIFQAYRKTNKIGTHPGRHKLFIGKLPVRVTRRVEHARARICHMRHDSRKFQIIHKTYRHISSAFQTERQHAAGA